MYLFATTATTATTSNIATIATIATTRAGTHKIEVSKNIIFRRYTISWYLKNDCLQLYFRKKSLEGGCVAGERFSFSSTSLDLIVPYYVVL